LQRVPDIYQGASIFHIGWFRPESRLFFRRADGFERLKAQAYLYFICKPDTGFFPGDVLASLYLVLTAV